MCEIQSYSLRGIDNLSAYRNHAASFDDKAFKISIAEYGYLFYSMVAMIEAVFEYTIGISLFFLSPYYGMKWMSAAGKSFAASLWAELCLITNLFFDRIYVWSFNDPL